MSTYNFTFELQPRDVIEFNIKLYPGDSFQLPLGCKYRYRSYF